MCVLSDLMRVSAVTIERQAHLCCAKTLDARKREVELGMSCTSLLGLNFFFDIDSMIVGAQGCAQKKG